MRRFLLLGLLIGVPVIAAEPPAAQSNDARDKVVCRREVPVGSLIATRKRCLTKSQWEQEARDGNETARRLMEDNVGRDFSRPH